MKAINQMKQHAKEMGCEDLLDDLIENQKPREPRDRPTKAEVKHRKERKKRNKVVKASRRRNR